MIGDDWTKQKDNWINVFPKDINVIQIILTGI